MKIKTLIYMKTIYYNNTLQNHHIIMNPTANWYILKQNKNMLVYKRTITSCEVKFNVKFCK